MGTKDTRRQTGPNVELIVKGSSRGVTLISRKRNTQCKYGNLSQHPIGYNGLLTYPHFVVLSFQPPREVNRVDDK